MTYHSKFNGESATEACGIPLLPVTEKDSYNNADTASHDIVDEAIHLFRARILFKNYKIKGGADKVIIYLTCFMQKLFEQMVRYPAKDAATAIANQICNDAAAINVGESSFFMNKLGLLSANSPVAEKRQCSEYLKKLMKECSKRLLEYLFREGEGDMNRKFWVGLGKRPFLGQKFVDKQYYN